MELKKNGIYDKAVLNVIEVVDRSLFVDENLKQKSNLNIALPIDCGQTISQPLVVAHMTQSLNLNKKLRVLEIGTGSGYQSYILSKLSRFVYTVERYSSLKKKAENLLKDLGANNIFFKHADGDSEQTLYLLQKVESIDDLKLNIEYGHMHKNDHEKDLRQTRGF